MEELSLKVLENNKETIYEVIATYHDENTNKNYVIYTDKSVDKERKLNIFYSLYELKDNEIILIETNDLEDQKVGLELIKKIGSML